MEHDYTWHIFCMSIRQESQDNRDHLQLIDMKSGILPPDPAWPYTAVSLHSVWQKSCSVHSLSGGRCKLFCRKLISLASLTEKCKDEPDYSKVTQLPNKDVFYALALYLERGDPTRWAKARLREVTLSAVCGKHFCLTLLRLRTGFRWRLRENLPAYWHWHFRKCLLQRGSVSCIITTLRLCVQSRQCDDQTESGPSFFSRKNTSAAERWIPLCREHRSSTKNYVALELVSHVRLKVRLVPR